MEEESTLCHCINPHFSYVPDCARTPTKISVRSGNYSDPATWNGGSVALVDPTIIIRLKQLHTEVTNTTAKDLIRQAIEILEVVPSVTGSIPQAGDIVLISEGHTVKVDRVFDEKVTIGVKGTLEFLPDRDTGLTCATILQYSMGSIVGSPNADKTLRIKIADETIDTNFDPDQFGTGLCLLGTTKLNGAAKTVAARVVGDIKAGDTTLSLKESPSGWRVGDLLELGDTRMIVGLTPYSTPVSPHNQYETAKIAAISGSTITLVSPVKFNHLAARNATDNTIRFTLPVLNKTRNLIIESVNPSGTRGHIIWFDRASIDVQNVLVKDLGRTKYTQMPGDRYDEHKLSLNSTVMSINVQTGGFGGLPAQVTLHRSGDNLTFVSGTTTVASLNSVTATLSHGKIVFTKTTSGLTTKAEGGRAFTAQEYKIVKIGTNQIARYPMHLHHVSGKANPTNTGYQFILKGNVIDNTVPTKWGIAIHHASYGLIQDNIVLNTQHWGIVTEDGSEYSNEFVGNYVATHSKGIAYYFSGPLNKINNNVAFNSFFGYAVNGGSPSRIVSYPTIRGSHSAADEQKIQMMNATLQSFDGNEAFGTSMAFQMYDFGTLNAYGGGDLNTESAKNKATRISNFKSWSNLRVTTFYHNFGSSTDEQIMGPHIITNLVAIGDVAQAKYSDTDGEMIALQWGGGCEVLVINPEIHGYAAAIRDRARQGNDVAGAIFKFQVNNGIFANKYDIHQDGNWTSDPDGKRIVLISPKFLPMINSSGGIVPKMKVRVTGGLLEGWMLAPNEIWIKDIDGSGKHLRVYSQTQHGSYVIPTLSPQSRVPTEYFGKTNAQVKALYGKSIGGAVVPASAVNNYSGIEGWVETLQTWPSGVEIS